MTTEYVTSADGTRIGYEVHGRMDAPTVVWVMGATAFRAFNPGPARFAELTALRVFAFDRRGRGESGDTLPYDPMREIEDISAVIGAAGGRAPALVGESSGAVLALEAARAGVAADRVVAYEPPLIVNSNRPPLPTDYVERLDEMNAVGDSAGAHRLFVTAAVGLPPEVADGLTKSPMWPLLEPVSRTLAYDGRIVRPYMTGDPAPLAAFAEITLPVLVAVGGDTASFILDGARALIPFLHDGRLEVIPGGTHQTDPELVARPFDAFIRDGIW
jgi:pimeloyl-ACP methyl ester carboxylesterase